MLCTCFHIFLIRMSILSCHPDLLRLKKNLQYTSTVFIYLKCTIPSVPSRSLLFRVLLIFILVACYFLISGPACSCCSLPYRWNMQASLSHSQEYSWSDDWQFLLAEPCWVQALSAAYNVSCNVAEYSLGAGTNQPLGHLCHAQESHLHHHWSSFFFCFGHFE